MTVNEFIEKLEKVKAEGYGEAEVVVGGFFVDGSFVPQSLVSTCYGYDCKGKKSICGLTTWGGSKLIEELTGVEVRDDA